MKAGTVSYLFCAPQHLALDLVQVDVEKDVENGRNGWMDSGHWLFPGIIGSRLCDCLKGRECEHRAQDTSAARLLNKQPMIWLMKVGIMMIIKLYLRLTQSHAYSPVS